MNYETLQQEHREWLAKNFPNQPPVHAAAGMVEEAGELIHCILKISQQHVFGTEPRYRDTHWGKEFVDCIGDCAIYCCSLCNALGWDFNGLVFAAHPETYGALSFEAAVDVLQSAIDVCRTFAETDVLLFLSRLKGVCKAGNEDFAFCVTATWNIVKERNRCS